MRSDDLTAEEIERYADGELALDEAVEAEEHLRSCARCAAAASSLLRMKLAVREAFPRHEVPGSLRGRLAATLGQPRADFQAASPAPHRSNAPWWLAAAAMLAFSILLLGVLHARSTATTRELADMHATLLASANPVEVLSTDKHTVKPWFEGRVPFAVPVPDFTGTAFHLIGGRVVFWRHATGAYLLVGKAAHRISVFVFPADAVPAGSPVPAVSSLSWRSGGLVFIAVADLPDEDLAVLRRAFQ
jgi:anti-sigma factor RsiW